MPNSTAPQEPLTSPQVAGYLQTLKQELRAVREEARENLAVYQRILKYLVDVNGQAADIATYDTLHNANPKAHDILQPKVGDKVPYGPTTVFVQAGGPPVKLPRGLVQTERPPQPEDDYDLDQN